MMGFVPYGMEYASLDDKHKIRKMLEYMGMTHPTQQMEFMSALLDKSFDSSKMSKQDFITLRSKLMNIQQTKDKA